MNKWQLVKLGDIASNIQTGPFGSQLHQSDYSEIGTPVVMPKDLVDGKISEQSIARVEASHVKRLAKHKIQNGDILYSRRGDVGRCAYAGKEESGWLCGTGCLRVTIDESHAFPKFIFYQLQTSQSVGWVEKHAVGSTMLNLNTSILSNVPVSLPPIEVQRKIADVLSAYDDLIENNRKQIKLLEEAAQRLYKEWFIDLRFPDYETTPIIDGIPSGWEKGSAIDFFNITIGKTPPRAESQCFTNGNSGIPWVSISDMGNSGIYISNTSEGLTQDAVNRYNVKVIPAGTILLSFKLTLGRVSITTVPCCTNEAIAHFYIENEDLRPYTFLYLKSFKYDTLGNTSSISKAVNSSIIKAMPFIMPCAGLITAFAKFAIPIFEKIYHLQKSINEAKSSRDRLLPKLMTGELEMK